MTRRGCKPRLPILRTEVVIFLKIDLYGAVRKPHLPWSGRVSNYHITVPPVLMS